MIMAAWSNRNRFKRVQNTAVAVDLLSSSQGVDAYLWWREADGQKDYLKNALKAADIKTRKRKGNAPNFYAIIRLIWDIDTSKRASAVSN
jgi:hypothetical protein